jgi:hypothetical protein
MPAQGALIRATDYTDVRRIVSRILGDKKIDFILNADAGTYGYGQTVLSDSRTITREVSLIDDADIASLKSDVLKIAKHCGLENNTLITALPSITAGDEVDNSHLESYIAALELLSSNRFELGAGQYSDGPFNIDISNSRTTPWGNNTVYAESTVRHSFTVDFGTPNAARYFFNSGGQIRFSASRTGGTNTFQDQTWTALLNSIGTVIFNHNSTSAASGTGSSIGYYQLTTTPQQVFTKNAGSIYVYATQYSTNDYTISVSCDAADNTKGDARYLYVSVYFNDDHTNTNPATPFSRDQVTGTLASNVSIRRATGENVQVSTPAATNTVLLTS